MARRIQGNTKMTWKETEKALIKAILSRDLHRIGELVDRLRFDAGLDYSRTAALARGSRAYPKRTGTTCSTRSTRANLSIVSESDQPARGQRAVAALRWAERQNCPLTRISEAWLCRPMSRSQWLAADPLRHRGTALELIVQQAKSLGQIDG
jgi:hypothetical protein